MITDKRSTAPEVIKENQLNNIEFNIVKTNSLLTEILNKKPTIIERKVDYSVFFIIIIGLLIANLFS